MKTENKYYTPSIEEFCVGFEYDLNCILLNNPISYNETTGKFADNWVKQIFNGKGIEWLQGYHYGTNIIEIDLNRTRVKHLDREDIESLGWKQDDYDSYKKYFYDNKFSIEYKIIFDPEYYIFITKTKCNSTEIIFKGKIQNKTELQKLMKQLNIE